MNKTIIAFFALVLILTACTTEFGETRVDTDRSFDKYSPSFYMTETEDTLYYCLPSGGGVPHLIYYIDKATGITLPLCGKPECVHNVNTCNAFTFTSSEEGDGRPLDSGDSYPYGLSVQNGRLYWAVKTSKDGLIIFSSALDGSDHRQVGMLGRELTPKVMANWSMSWTDRYAFFSCITGTVEDGVETDHNYVCAIPLESDEEPTVILNERTNYSLLAPIQVYGGYLYIITSSINGSFEDMVNGDIESYSFMILRWNLETHELETVYEDTDSHIKNPNLMWVNDGCILFNDYSDENGEWGVDRYDFETGGCEHLFNSGIKVKGTYGFMDFADGKVVRYWLPKESEDASLHTIIMDFEGNVLLEGAFEPELGEGAQVYDLLMNGADSENVYFTLFTRLEDVSTRMTFITVALDGSGARTLGTLELPGY